MSRSRKRNPFIRAKVPGGKNFAARFIRRLAATFEIPNGSFYKNLYPRWDVIDYIIYGLHPGWKNDPNSQQFKKWYIRK